MIVCIPFKISGKSRNININAPSQSSTRVSNVLLVSLRNSSSVIVSTEVHPSSGNPWRVLQPCWIKGTLLNAFLITVKLNLLLSLFFIKISAEFLSHSNVTKLLLSFNSDAITQVLRPIFAPISKTTLFSFINNNYVLSNFEVFLP